MSKVMKKIIILFSTLFLFQIANAHDSSELLKKYCEKSIGKNVSAASNKGGGKGELLDCKYGIMIQHGEKIVIIPYDKVDFLLIH